MEAKQPVTKQPKGNWRNQRGQMKTKTQQSKIYGIQQDISKREVYSNRSLTQKIRKSLVFYLKGTRERVNKTASYQKERIKNRAEINEIEIVFITEKKRSMKLRTDSLKR